MRSAKFVNCMNNILFAEILIFHFNSIYEFSVSVEHVYISDFFRGRSAFIDFMRDYPITFA